MNLQTVKPRARYIRLAQGLAVSSNNSYFFDRSFWIVRFPDSDGEGSSANLNQAISIAYRRRLDRMTGGSHK